ncbi:MAG: hypothetical protein FE048_05175 [Thermoplasmata archaeon]|nr:MAG: hypothetical protein FE048_05175 [Thermoplasmata archaeon]
MTYSRNGILIKGNGNVVQNCTIYENGGGIIIKKANKNEIRNCIFYKNGIGVELHESSENEIELCKAHTNGMGIYLEKSSKNVIERCNVYKNSGNEGGIFLISSDSNKIGNSTLSYNVWSIRMVECIGNAISNCSITKSRYGIKMENCRANEIYRCNILHNRYGIYLEKCGFEKINFNNIEGNYMYGIYAKLSFANARHNWWGSPIGPRGRGDRLTTLASKISYIPWLLQPLDLQEMGIKKKNSAIYHHSESSISIERDIRPLQLTDWDPLVDLKLSVHILRIRNVEVEKKSLFASVNINGKEKESEIWRGFDVQPRWTTTQDIPDDKENIPIIIQIWEKGLVKKLCLELDIIYNLERGEWFGCDYLGDNDGYGHIFEGKYELWFDISFNDYDGDGLTYWEENILYHTNPKINDSGKDFDNDGIPIEWEDKWGYNPFIYENHTSLDPDNDGIENIEEWKMAHWFSDPYRKDIFIEVDHMAARNKFSKPYILPEKSKQMLYTTFTSHHIMLHIDDGCMGGGEEIPYKERITYNETKEIYWQYFLRNSTQNPRKGIFHYVILCSYGATSRGGHAFQGWDNLDTFVLAVQYIRDWRLKEKEREIVMASLFMHELGHTLGLFEFVFDGIDNESCNAPWLKGWWIYRNYKSCLNYRYSFSIINYSDGTHGKNDFDDWGNIDLTFFQNSSYYF